MYVIGISSGLKAGHHDGAAVLMRDGELLAAADEERFTKAKHARGELPRRAIKFCLEYAGIQIEDVDVICSPLATYANFDKRVADFIRFHFGYSPRVELFDHHLCHAASTYFGAGYQEATVICLDYSGDSSSGLIAHGKNGDLRVLTRFPRESSLGLYYGMMTQFLGFQMTNDEYKVMGLASSGSPTYQDAFHSVLAPSYLGYDFDGKFDRRQRDTDVFTTDFSTRQERIFTEDLEVLLGPRRIPGQPIDDRIRNIAASVQYQLELVVTSLIKDAVQETGCPDVALAGGVGLNCKMNMEVNRLPEVRRLYVPPVPHDAGVALGAAMLKCAAEGHAITPIDHAYFGPAYAPDKIRKCLDQVGARYAEAGDPVSSASRELAAGRIVGWFQGRMEYGPRALGNRSILAHPGDPAVKDRVNATIKYREEFRPFCPSVLLESQADYFEADHDSPFMVVTFPAKARAVTDMPAVVHVDDTARIQSVRTDTNPLYHELISSFAERTGVPALLNTSLNINEQPLANSPLDALQTFFISGLDVLYLGPFRIAKPGIADLLEVSPFQARKHQFDVGERVVRPAVA